VILLKHQVEKASTSREQPVASGGSLFLWRILPQGKAQVSFPVEKDKTAAREASLIYRLPKFA